MNVNDRSRTLIEKPWHDANVSKHFTRLVGMLGLRESVLLYYLARDYYVGLGEIIDAGAFLGSSSAFLARGLHENRVCTRKHHRIHAYDTFIADDSLNLAFIRRKIPDFPSSGSFLPLYQQSVSEFLPYISIHEGDFAKSEWGDSAIELLFVDIAKTPQLNCVLIEQFFSRLIPSHSLVIHQDYHHPSHPYIHITMELLSSYFDIVDERVDNSIVFLNTAPIPSSVISELNATALSRDESLRLMDAAIERLSPGKRQHVELARAVLLKRLGDIDGFTRELQRLDERYSSLDDEYWHMYRKKVS